MSKVSIKEFEEIFSKYILIEMEFHAKALEELTKAYQCLQCPMKVICCFYLDSICW